MKDDRVIALLAGIILGVSAVLIAAGAGEVRSPFATSSSAPPVCISWPPDQIDWGVGVGPAD